MVNCLRLQPSFDSVATAEGLASKPKQWQDHPSLAPGGMATAVIEAAIAAVGLESKLNLPIVAIAA